MPYTLKESVMQIEPLSITPEQGLFHGTTAHLKEEAFLFKAVLENALRDIFFHHPSFRNQRLFDEAMRWIDDEPPGDGYIYPVSFSFCCEAIGADPGYIRRLIRNRLDFPKEELVADGVTWREAFGKWGERFLVSRTGEVFDRRWQTLVPPHLGSNDSQDWFVTLRDASGGWQVLLSRVVARTWGGANRYVKVQFRDGNQRNCAFENVEWDTEKYDGQPFQLADSATCSSVAHRLKR